MRGLKLFLGVGSNEPRTGTCVKSRLVWSFWEFSPFSEHLSLGGKPFKARMETKRG